jgi:hypothetical protein
MELDARIDRKENPKFPIIYRDIFYKDFLVIHIVE